MIQPLQIKVRFRDCDLMGHVNNAVYLTYFEQTRIYYLEKLLNKEWDYQEFGIILLKNEITYLKPIHLNEILDIELFSSHIGNKSFTFSYKIKVDNELRTTGSSVLVCYNFNTEKTVPIYPEFFNCFSKLKQK